MSEDTIIGGAAEPAPEPVIETSPGGVDEATSSNPEPQTLGAEPKTEYNLPENWTTNEGMQSKFKTVNGLASAYENLEKMISKKGAIHPGDEATEDELNNYYNQLGRPETPEGYEFSAPEGMPEGFDPSEVSSLVHSLGLNKEQAKGVYEAYTANIMNGIKHNEDAAVQQRESALQELQELPEFKGSNFDKSAAIVKQALQQNGQAELAQDPAFGNNPKLIKLVYDLAKKGLEGQHINGDTPQTTGDINAEIEKLHTHNFKLMQEDQLANKSRIQKNADMIYRLNQRIHGNG